MDGEEGEVADELLEGGSVSHDKVRRQDCRIIENEVGASGSFVEV